MPAKTLRELGSMAAELLAHYRASRRRLDVITAHLEGRTSGIYVPRSATQEYRILVDQAKGFNVLPTVVDALVRNLFVDGFRSTNPETGRPVDRGNAGVWDRVWQPNRMDARQTALYRAAAEYGHSYATVLPGRLDGERVPVINPYSPRQLTAVYNRLDDEWPRAAMVTDQPLIAEPHLYGDPLADPIVPNGVKITLIDDEHIYRMVRRSGGWAADRMVERHGLGVVPVVRYLDESGRTDRLPPGKVEPLMAAQRQLTQISFNLLMAQQYGAFKQRWVTGMAVAEDENGNPVEPFNAAVNRLWQAEEDTARFGEFAQTDLKGYIDSRDKVLLYVASVAPLPPHDLLVGAGISNISAEALVALEASHRHDIAAHKTTHGESVEQMHRLAGLTMGDMDVWRDRSAQVVWRDTTPRSLGQIADALGKMAQMLQIPVQALWERLPEVTDQDIRRWEQMAAEQGLEEELQLLVEEGRRAVTPGQPAGTPVPA